MISVAIKKAVSNESEEAKLLRDEMLGSIMGGFNNKDIKIADGGKPYLEGGKAGISVSHSNGAVLVAVSGDVSVPNSHSYFEGGKGYDIGADIEALGIRNIESLEMLSDKKFSAAESEIVEKSADKELAILSIWTKKEAYLKLIGIGIKGIKGADTEALKNDYIFHTEKIALEGGEFVFSVCTKR